MQLSRSLSSIDSGAAAEKKRMKPFACFRPVVTLGEFKHGRRLDGPSQPIFTGVPKGEVDRQTFPRMLPAAFSSVKDDVGGLRPRKKCGCFGFSRILKLILSSKTRKSRQKSNPKSKTQDSNTKSQQFCRDEDPKIISNTSSFSSSRASTAFTSTSLCSSCSSSLALNSRASSDLHNKTFRSNPKKSDQKIEERPRSRNWWWLLLICLSCLILWGKFCALCCSMAWLFYFLHQRIRSSPTVKRNMAIDSQEHRKKVIMEGLLDRDRSSSLTLPTKKKGFFF